MHDLIPFQSRFVKKALAPETMTAALSLPRGNGKSWLAARICADAMKELKPEQEIALCAASIEQARIVFRFTRAILGEPGYRYLDSSTRAGITRHDGGRLRVVGSNAKTSFGLVHTPIVVADEPGAWEINGGQLLHDAIETAQGKPGSPLRAVYIGTFAPLARDEKHWWYALATKKHGPHIHSVCLQGDPDKWDSWPEIMRVNPLARIAPELREKLKIEREEARIDERLKARFLSYRLNVPSADTSKMLIDVAAWKKTLAREAPPREGKPIVAIDLGSGRAWSAACALWENGRTEALGVAPGLPDIAAQEKRDRVPAGRYQALVKSGQLRVSEGLHVPPVKLLWEFILNLWGAPARVVADRFRMLELTDSIGSTCTIEPRVSQWSESSFDIRALRKLVSDGPLSVADGRELLSSSLAVAQVRNDESGNVKIIKQANNTARDDVAAALTLAAGAHARLTAKPSRKRRFALTA